MEAGQDNGDGCQIRQEMALLAEDLGGRAAQRIGPAQLRLADSGLTLGHDGTIRKVRGMDTPPGARRML